MGWMGSMRTRPAARARASLVELGTMVSLMTSWSSTSRGFQPGSAGRRLLVDEAREVDGIAGVDDGLGDREEAAHGAVGRARGLSALTRRLNVPESRRSIIRPSPPTFHVAWVISGARAKMAGPCTDPKE